MLPDFYSLSNFRYFVILTVFSLLSSQAYYAHAAVAILSDIAKPLTPEQITELEKDPQSMVNKCVNTVEDTKGHSDKLQSYEKDQLQLCDNFMSYLQDKCRDFNNLLEYCMVDPLISIEQDIYGVINYDIDRLTQLNCLEDINYGSEYGSFCKEYFSNFTKPCPPVSNITDKTINQANITEEALNQAASELINNAVNKLENPNC